jgi:hypothetical protein
MDLIRHPGEPNSWALALVADRKQVQFVINLHTHIASGLAEKQMAQLVTQMNNRDVKYTEQLTLVTEQMSKQMREQERKHIDQMSSMRMIIETSILGKRQRDKVKCVTDASETTNKLNTIQIANHINTCDISKLIGIQSKSLQLQIERVLNGTIRSSKFFGNALNTTPIRIHSHTKLVVLRSVGDTNSNSTRDT